MHEGSRAPSADSCPPPPLVALYAICVPSEEALAIRDEVAFFEAVRGQITKIEGTDREGVDPSALLDTAIKQIVSQVMSGTGVIDIYQEAGLAKPDLSLIDEGFIEKFKTSREPEPANRDAQAAALPGDQARR